jgi:malonyl CoA-acyl carrier protein transacylase
MHTGFLLFPGQGAQAVGMARDAYEAGGHAVALFEEASEILGFDLAHMVFEEDEAVLLSKDADQVLPRLFETAAAAGARITEVSVTEPNLEMVFLPLTGRALRE